MKSRETQGENKVPADRIEKLSPHSKYCFWQNCQLMHTVHGRHGASYVYFFHLEDCLKYCETIKYVSDRGKYEAHYLEIGKVIQDELTTLTTFNLAWDDPCNGPCYENCCCSNCDSDSDSEKT